MRHRADARQHQLVVVGMDDGERALAEELGRRRVAEQRRDRRVGVEDAEAVEAIGEDALGHELEERAVVGDRAPVRGAAAVGGRRRRQVAHLRHQARRLAEDERDAPVAGERAQGAEVVAAERRGVDDDEGHVARRVGRGLRDRGHARHAEAARLQRRFQRLRRRYVGEHEGAHRRLSRRLRWPRPRRARRCRRARRADGPRRSAQVRSATSALKAATARDQPRWTIASSSSTPCTSAAHARAVPGHRLLRRRLRLQSDLQDLPVGDDAARHARRNVHAVARLQ